MLNEIDLSRVDLNLLVLFEAVLAERHVGRTAARLRLTPSAVSHGLGRLRRMLNDPLFLKNPKGVVPTARASLLAAPIAEVLAGARRVIGGAGEFDPKTSVRRFVVGAPDAVAAVLVSRLIVGVRRAAPFVDLAFRNVLPPWDAAFADLDRRALDVALLPCTSAPARFAARVLFDEPFVITMRRGHTLGRAPSLERYCAAEHVLVSLLGDPSGHVDFALAKRGLSRRISLIVPTFMMALAVVGETDLVSALPRMLVRAYAKRFGVVAGRVPLAVDESPVQAFAPAVALADGGVAWLLDQLRAAVAQEAK